MGLQIYPSDVYMLPLHDLPYVMLHTSIFGRLCSVSQRISLLPKATVSCHTLALLLFIHLPVHSLRFSKRAVELL